MKTYGNILDWNEWQKEVGSKLSQYVLLKPKRKTVKLARKLFNQGYSVNDAVRIIIVNS